jgi:hypothetical protein
MFKEIKGGTKVLIKDAFGVDFECWVPPVGYGCIADAGEDPETGELRKGILGKTDIIKRSEKPEEQYWEREVLPSWYNRKREAELEMQELDPDYVDDECEKIRERHWRRRLYGVWFWNNGVLTYITGLHWFVLNWWKFQGKYFDFRIPNMELFYVADYVIEDPDSLGLNEITKRKDGKTARLGAFLYEYPSRVANKHAGLQSKTDGDAWEVFKKAITAPWRKLPHFFRPKYNTTAGDDPNDELRFFNPSRRGRKKKSDVYEEPEALESFIDYESRGVLAYDGPELHRYGSDESGKNKDISIVERHGVVQFCSEVNGTFIGKQWYTTTVEEMESGGSEFKKLVKMCDRREKDANGRTKSGLYCYFLPAYRTLFFDKYGFPDEERAKTYYLNRRAVLANEPRELSSFIRKNPFTLAEAFRIDGEKCLYDPEKLNDQRDILTWRSDELVERGEFVWKNGEPFTEVEWSKNPNGRFKICRGFKNAAANKVIKRNDHFYPNNTFALRVGCDPFKFDKTKDQRRSNCASYAYKMYDALDKNNPFNDAFVVRYNHRAATTAMQYDDVLKMVWYFGCQVLFESNVDNWKDFFKMHKCEGFLMKLPGETEPGIYSDGQGRTLQMIADYTEAYINEHIKKVFFIELIDDWLEFDIGNTTKFDDSIGAGLTLIAARQKVYKRSIEGGRDIDDYFDTFKATG